MIRISDEVTWKAAGFAAAAGAAARTHLALKHGWNAATDTKPPSNPAAETAWTEAFTWTAASSLVVRLARLVAKRQAGRFKRGPVPALAF